MSASVIVWDQNTDPPRLAADVWRWNAFTESGGVGSIPRYVEAHAQRLRAKYLAFIYELGEHQIDGARVVDHLNPDNDLSFWWLTLLAEKSPLKSPRIYCCIRLLALEEILSEKRPQSLALVSADRELALAARALCKRLNVKFSWRLERRPAAPFSLRTLYHKLPYALQGLIVLIHHLNERWALRKAAKPAWFPEPNAIFFCSYFIHLDRAACLAGHFYSRQWGPLPEFCHDRGARTNWLQHFMVSAAVPQAETAAAWVDGFNHGAEREGFHALLDSYLTPALVWRVLKRWLRLNIRGWKLRKIQSAFYPQGSAVWLWPILRADWRTSVAGPVAINGCLWIELFDAALRDIPRQSTGLYLCENQGWERAMLRGWRKNGHGRIIGVQHATAPFWHLYYFDDPRNWSSRNPSGMPTPDQLAVNGPDALNSFVKAGYPASELVETEALRYLHLIPRSGAIANNVIRRSVEVVELHSEVLILGDMIPATMEAFLRLIERASHLLPSGFDFAFKPHPGYDVDLTRYPGLNVRKTHDALDVILGEFDVVVAANSTSSAVEAFVLGLPVIVMLDGTGFNLSPLRGHAGVTFVATEHELVGALARTRAPTELAPDNQEMFYLDPSLPRWERLLAPAFQS